MVNKFYDIATYFLFTELHCIVPVKHIRNGIITNTQMASNALVPVIQSYHLDGKSVIQFIKAYWYKGVLPMLCDVKIARFNTSPKFEYSLQHISFFELTNKQKCM